MGTSLSLDEDIAISDGASDIIDGDSNSIDSRRTPRGGSGRNRTSDSRNSQFHSPCGNTPRNPADKNVLAGPALNNCGKRRKSPSVFRDETRSSGMEGTAILSKPLQCDAEFFRTHPLLPLLTKKTFVLKEETWS